MLFKIFVLGLVLIACSTVARAQTACPPGLVPYAAGAGGGAAACGPDPSYNQQTQQLSRPPLWKNKWGAIATGLPGSPPAFGAAVDMRSERAARKAALKDCEASKSKCQIAITYRNECAAVVTGEKSWVIFDNFMKDDAIRKGMDKCKADGNTECHVYYAGCSYPVRIQ